jgi:hypothetical protein
MTESIDCRFAVDEEEPGNNWLIVRSDPAPPSDAGDVLSPESRVGDEEGGGTSVIHNPLIQRVTTVTGDGIVPRRIRLRSDCPIGT